MVDMEASGGEEPGLVSVQGRQGNVSFRPYSDIKTRTEDMEVEETEDEASVKEEEINNPRSFALFDSPSKFRMQSKGSSHSQFYDKQVRNSEANYEQY